ncbi:TPA: glycosyltransferase family 25 protein [Providencia alcalifaciens]
METLVVSLQKSERRADFKKKFRGLNFKFFDAITPDNQENINFDDLIFRSIYGRNARKGEVGCTLSHFSILNAFINHSLDDWILILEDDAIPEKEFFNFIKEFESNYKTENPEVILLGHSKTSKKHLLVQRMKQPLRNKINIKNIIFGENNNITLCGTVGYLINKKAACLITELKKNYWLADDWKMFSNLGIHVFHPQKPIVWEDLNYASSTENIVKYQHDFLNSPIKNIVHIIIGRYKFYNDNRKI